MSMKKRILSAVAAMAVAVTSIVSVTVTSAANPTIVGTYKDGAYVWENYLSSLGGAAGVEFTFENMPANISGVQFNIKIPKDLRGEEKVKKEYFARELSADNMDLVDMGDITASYWFDQPALSDDNYNVLTFQATTTSGWDTSSAIAFAFTADGFEDDSFNESYDITKYPEAFAISNVSLTVVGNNTPIAVDVVQAEIPGGATPEPTATPTPTPVVTPEPTPTVEPTPEVTPEPVAGVEKFSDTDAAAWAWETAAVAGSKVKVTVTDGTTEGAKTFDLNAAVEGSVKVGVIVQYNPTAFPNFAIVDVEIQ